MLDRFTGEAKITFRDGSSEVRRVIILSPYIQSSKSLHDIDYEHSLVVDLQTMEFDFKVQLEEMLQNQELHAHHTFIDYAHKTVFRNGENVLAWLHRMKQIHRVPAADVKMIFGQGGNVQKMPLTDLNSEIRANNEKKIAEEEGYQSSYTDPSMTEDNISPATIERSGNAYKEPVSQPVQNENTSTLNESVVSESTSEPVSQHEATNVDLSQVPGVKILEGDPSLASMEAAKTTSQEPVSEPVSQAPTPSSYTEFPKESESVSKQEFSELQQNLQNLESLVKKRTKDTFVTRLMDKYELSEAEVTKAIESAGKRKEKKAEKDKLKQQDSNR